MPLLLSISLLLLIIFGQASKLIRIPFGSSSISSYPIFALIFILSAVIIYIIKKRTNKELLNYFFIFFVFLLLFTTYTILYIQIYMIDIKYMFALLINIPIFLILYYSVYRYSDTFDKIYKIMGIYVFILFLLIITAFLVSGIEFQDLIRVIFTASTYLHTEGKENSLVYAAFKIEEHLLGRQSGEQFLTGVQLSIYPFIYFMLHQLAIIQNSNISRFAFFTYIISIIFVLLFNSRGMTVSMLLIFIVMNYRNKYLIKSILIFVSIIPVVSLISMNQDILSGRGAMAELFINNFTLLGNGIGSSFQDVKELTRMRGTHELISYHNIHFEFIHNFGYILYLMIFLFFWYKIIVTIDILKLRILSIIYILTFVLMGTNLNLLDFYYIFPLAVLLGIMKRYNKNIKYRKIKR